jgi:hypothetical protein
MPEMTHAHNLFGHHGPRCQPCSGLGHVLLLGAPGRPTKHATRCVCKGTGVDQEWVREQEMSTLLRRIEALERRLGPEVRSQTGLVGLNSRQYWEELIAWATSDGTAVADTTTETIVFPNVTLPANYMQDGRALRLRSFGKLSTTGTPTMTWAVRWGGVSGTLLATTEAVTMGSGMANVNWSLDIEIQTRSNGATGTLLVFGDLRVHTSSTAVAVNVFSVSGYDAPAAVSADLTADTALSLTADWSAQSASNTLTGMLYGLHSQN